MNDNEGKSEGKSETNKWDWSDIGKKIGDKIGENIRKMSESVDMTADTKLSRLQERGREIRQLPEWEPKLTKEGEPEPPLKIQKIEMKVEPDPRKDLDNVVLGGGIRYNEGKIRHDLVPAFAQNEMARVLTYGSKKYSDRNWEKGMKWSNVLGSLERHLNAFKNGEDVDPESGLTHISHLMCNAMFLVQYTCTYPQGDDRPKWYKLRPRIGLDIDDVLADCMGHWAARYGVGNGAPDFWHFDYDIKSKLLDLAKDEEFWMSMPVKTNPKDIPFEPICYITSRKCPIPIIERWLSKNGFPAVPVIYSPGSKVDAAKSMKLDWFVDDRFENFVELNDAGICCFLFDASHNRRYDVQRKRVISLMDLPLVAKR